MGRQIGNCIVRRKAVTLYKKTRKIRYQNNNKNHENKSYMFIHSDRDLNCWIAYSNGRTHPQTTLETASSMSRMRSVMAFSSTTNILAPNIVFENDMPNRTTVDSAVINLQRGLLHPIPSHVLHETTRASSLTLMPM